MALLSEEHAKTSVAFIQKLAGLSIKATIEKVEPGPVVTAYYFKPAMDVPISKILNKADDFALAAEAEKVTIQRIGGHIVIFAANKQRKLIEFKEYLNWYMLDKKPNEMEIPIPLGVDHLGNKAALDLVTCPHILLAGETGSGKSVLESSIISCLSIQKDPKELELYLVDTKQLDLPLFRGLPQVQDVITTPSEFQKTMEKLWAVHNARKILFGNQNVRNIREFHGQWGEDGKSKVPYIVLLIDELADLIMQDKEERNKLDKEDQKPKVEEWLQRFAQGTRATGIHIIAGTQRTSVKIISGDIKVNFPCRISLRLPTEFDSRTILGTDGAEQLLGKGDMLVKRPDSETLYRYHGPFVNLQDIAWITVENDYVREMYKSIKRQRKEQGSEVKANA